MKLNDSVSLVLKIFMYAGVIVMAIGLFLSEESPGPDILKCGIMILLLAPIAGLVTAYGSLIKEKDWFWVKIASVLVFMICVGIAVTVLF